VVNENRLASVHWVHGELALHRDDNETAATLFEEAMNLETRIRLQVYYAALHAVATYRAGYAAKAHETITNARRLADSFETPNVAVAMLEAADAVVTGTKSDGFNSALTMLSSAKKYPAVLEDQLKENREAVRIRLWKARAEFHAGTNDRAQVILAEALNLGHRTLGSEHPFVSEQERMADH